MLGDFFPMTDLPPVFLRADLVLWSLDLIPMLSLPPFGLHRLSHRPARRPSRHGQFFEASCGNGSLGVVGSHLLVSHSGYGAIVVSCSDLSLSEKNFPPGLFLKKESSQNR